MQSSLVGTILRPEGFRQGRISFQGQITDIEEAGAIKTAPYILPGFIDVHVHGGGGADVMDGADGVKRMARFHMQHGTTTLYPTTITNPMPNILEALQGLKNVIQDKSRELPSIPGAHLEGPFINPHRLGAQPPDVLEPDEVLLQQLLGSQIVKIVTLAPEMPNVCQMVKHFVELDVQVSIGHTNASFEDVIRFKKEIDHYEARLGFTHLFNAMGGIEGRKPGVVGAALLDKTSYAELIFDRHHVHEASFHLALAVKQDKLLFITDAMRACGMTEGESELGGQTVFIRNGKAHLEDGTLAGSLLTLDQALRNAVEAGLSLKEASNLVSRNPATYMNLTDRGTLEPGKRADFVVLDKDLNVLEVYVEGKKLVG